MAAAELLPLPIAPPAPLLADPPAEPLAPAELLGLPLAMPLEPVEPPADPLVDGEEVEAEPDPEAEPDAAVFSFGCPVA